MDNSFLKQYGLKNTPGRQAVLSVLARAEGPVTAEELHRRLAEEPGQGDRRVSLSTVYRTLLTLTEKGLLLRGPGPDGSFTYQLRDSRHRHYLVCTGCGSAVPIPGCPLETLEQSIGAETGFAITGHSLELFGLCPSCAQREKK